MNAGRGAVSVEAVKGIIYACGSATPFGPMTAAVPKNLLPVADKPMVHYPLSVLMLAGVRDVLIVAPSSDLHLFRRLLGAGDHLGMRFGYAAQSAPDGVAGALLIGEDHIGDDQVAFVPGDDVFHGPGFRHVLREQVAALKGCALFAHGAHASGPVPTGLRLYDNDVADVAREVSARGGTEITAIDRAYSERGLTTVVELGRGFAYLHLDSPEALLDASRYVRTLEQRQGVGIACLEEVALRMGFIDADACADLGRRYGDSPYGRYVLAVAAEFAAESATGSAGSTG